MRVLDIDINWRMHKLSDGQRRRALLAAYLLRPRNVFLIDEATIDMDVLVRRDLLQYLKEETEARNVCVVYCTHIFDGLGSWATQVVHLANGELKHSCAVRTRSSLIISPRGAIIHMFIYIYIPIPFRKWK